jgi:Holliday junction resolvasome RuvABC endonuclease subunit
MGDTRVVAIDGATKVTGMALVVNGDLKDYGKIDLSSNTDTVDERLLLMGEKIWKALDIWKPDIIYMEEPQGHGKNLKVSGLIHELIGFAKAWAVKNNAFIETIAPSEWRKFLNFRQGSTVKRAELKQQSMDFVQDMFGLNVTDDISDAICIACAFIQKYEGEKD